MPGTVGNVRNQVHIFAFLTAKQTIHCINHHLDDVDVLPFVEASDVVGLGDLALVEDKVDGASMVFDIQPVAHVFAFAIHRQRLAVTDVVDKQRDQLLGELIRTVVVRTVGHDGRHAVSVVESTDKVVAAGLTGTVGAVRVVFGGLVEEVFTVGQVVLARRGFGGKGRLNAFGMSHLQSSIDLVGRDVVEAFALVLLRQ